MKKLMVLLCGLTLSGPALAEEVNTGYGAILQRTLEREALGKKVNNTRRLQSAMGLGLQNAAALERVEDELLILAEEIGEIKLLLGQDSEILLRIRQIQENQHTVEVTNNITVTQENDQDSSSGSGSTSNGGSSNSSSEADSEAELF